MSQPIASNRSSSIGGIGSTVPLSRTGTPLAASAAPPVPSMHTPPVSRHDELLGILQAIDALPPDELRTSDLPEQAGRLLGEIQAARSAPAAPVARRSFQLIERTDTVGRCLLELKKAARRGDVPVPYPVDRDPLWLRAWVAKLRPHEVDAIGREFPQLRSALCVYIDASGTNHLARRIHAGANLDFDIDLSQARTWQLIPAHDAIRHGPTANFILLTKVLLFAFPRREAIPLAEHAVEEFISVRSKDEIASLVRHCERFSWPDTISIAPESKDFYSASTQDNPVEDILCELIAPILATHPAHSSLLSLMADINPAGLTSALRPLNFVPTDAMINQAITRKGREALRKLKSPG